MPTLFARIYRSNYTRSTLSGVLLGVGYVLSTLWPLVFVGSALLVHLLVSARNHREAFVWASIAGACGYGLSLSVFIVTTLPLDWLGIYSPLLGALAVFCVWMLAASSLALGFGLSFMFVKLASGGLRRRIFALFPLAWVVQELLSPFLFSIVHLGPFSRVGADFSVASFSYLLSESSLLLQGAWFGGIFMLAATIGCVGLVLYWIVLHTPWNHEWRILSAGMIICLLWLSGAVGFVYPDNSGKSFSVGVITLHEPPGVYTDEDAMNERFRVLKELYGTSSAGLIVFPEDSRFLASLYEQGDSPRRASSVPSFILDSATTRGYDGALRSRIEAHNVQNQHSDFVYKSVLVPLGEYVPYVYRVILSFSGADELLDRLESERGFRASNQSPRPLIVEGAPVAVALCEESASAFWYRAQVASGAELITNLSSHAWFHNSRLVHEASVRFAQVRAVESRRFFVRSANAAPAFIVSPYGKVVAQESWGAPNLIEEKVMLRRDTTPYVRFGILPVVVLLFVYVAFVLCPQRRSRA